MTEQITIGNSSSAGATTGVTATTPAAPAAQAPSPVRSMEFEKAAVATSIVKTAGSAVVETYGENVSIDDRVRVVTEYRVKSVGFEVQKDGSIARIQVMVPEGEPMIVPWNPMDPTDNGIVRARP